MVIVVTGGAGFIGQHLVRQLVGLGGRVRVIERPGAKVDHLPPIVDVVEADIVDRAAVRRAVQGAEVVYHLAANPQLWTHQRGQFHQVNYRGAVHVIEEALAAGARRVLHTSTESILTRIHQATPIAEDQVVPRDEVIGPYCQSKYRAECFALELGKSGAPVVIVNPTLPIGPGDWGRSPPTQMMLDCCLGKRQFYLEADLNLIDVRDVASGMQRTMEVGHPGRRYLLGGENWSIRRVFEFLAERTHQPLPTRRVPYAVALLAAYISEFIADVWTHEMPAASVTGVKLTRRRMHFDASRTWAELGLTPRPVDATLTEVIEWFHHVGWLDSGNGTTTMR